MKLSDFCWLFKSQDIIKPNSYSLGKPNKKVFDGVGDYVLIMKKNFIMNDDLTKINYKKRFKALHGGVSKDEMFVPLIRINC